ncbi:MAG: hypothetical protein A2542_03070 [Parcubacteria group bacterium RIFOXYD2_FULL_52_8]|nr:MAG: hypothetical protein A2542_03070 [Parcubacteria group bacterium RIFOXYD2_FULL_52_8]
MILSLIVAYDRNRVIGHGGSLPWEIPTDMQYFREKTRGKPVIMGRKTHESIGRALPKRLNIVVTRQAGYVAANECVVAGSLIEAIALGKKQAEQDGVSEVMVIGGGELYRQALPSADRVYATEIDAEFLGDTTLPELGGDEWEVASQNKVQDETSGVGLNFVVYERRN